MQTNADGERIEKVEAREKAAEARMQSRGLVVVECPHCGMPLIVPTDGTARICNGEGEYAGCGRSVTISECQA
jgi:ribosomal protein S27E